MLFSTCQEQFIMIKNILFSLMFPYCLRENFAISASVPQLLMEQAAMKTVGSLGFPFSTRAKRAIKEEIVAANLSKEDGKKNEEKTMKENMKLKSLAEVNAKLEIFRAQLELFKGSKLSHKSRMIIEEAYKKNEPKTLEEAKMELAKLMAELGVIHIIRCRI